MNNIVHQILEDNGEGVIIRKLNSIYEHGRTPNLLKIKVLINNILIILII